jgi:hypothetical protein
MAAGFSFGGRNLLSKPLRLPIGQSKGSQFETGPLPAGGALREATPLTPLEAARLPFQRGFVALDVRVGSRNCHVADA